MMLLDQKKTIKYLDLSWDQGSVNELTKIRTLLNRFLFIELVKKFDRDRREILRALRYIEVIHKHLFTEFSMNWEQWKFYWTWRSLQERLV